MEGWTIIAPPFGNRTFPKHVQEKLNMSAYNLKTIMSDHWDRYGYDFKDDRYMHATAKALVVNLASCIEGELHATEDVKRFAAIAKRLPDELMYHICGLHHGIEGYELKQAFQTYMRNHNDNLFSSC